MKTYKVGLIGFGFIGRVHAYGYSNLPFYYDQDRFGGKIVKVCTSRPETAEKAGALLNVPAVTDFRAITEDPEIDIVDIASPNDCHYAELASAIRHNKHIYCDKPLCETGDEARKLAALLPEYRGIAQMTLMYRFFPAVLRAKELIDAGRIGRVLDFRAAFLHSGSVSADTPYKWKLKAGTLADLGSHVLDLMQFLIGPAESLSASSFIAYPQRRDFRDPGRMVDISAEDSIHCILTLSGGASGVVSASKIATGSEDELSFAVYGDKGALRMDPMNLQQLYFYDNTAPDTPHGGRKGWQAIDCGGRYGSPAVFPAPKAVMGWLRGHVHCLYHFLESVHENITRAPSLPDGIELQLLMEKVREAVRTGRRVALR